MFRFERVGLKTNKIKSNLPQTRPGLSEKVGPYNKSGDSLYLPNIGLENVQDAGFLLKVVPREVRLSFSGSGLIYPDMVATFQFGLDT